MPGTTIQLACLESLARPWVFPDCFSLRLVATQIFEVQFAAS